MSACNSGQAAGYSDDDEDERRYVYDALLLPQTAAPGERLPFVPFSIFMLLFFISLFCLLFYSGMRYSQLNRSTKFLLFVRRGPVVLVIHGQRFSLVL